MDDKYLADSILEIKEQLKKVVLKLGQIEEKLGELKGYDLNFHAEEQKS
jgi:hypothetical protein